VVLVHGSGPGASALSNWRLTMPALAGTAFQVMAPDLVALRPDRAPGRHRLSAPDLDRPPAGRAGCPGHRAGPPGCQLDGGRGGTGPGHPVPGPGRPPRADGGGRRALHPHPGLDAVWGYQPSVAAMQELLGIFAYDTSIIGPDLPRACATAPAFGPVPRRPSPRCSQNPVSSGWMPWPRPPGHPAHPAPNPAGARTR
jgi:2-hydroxymuconate-semialdehyde hydrolase